MSDYIPNGLLYERPVCAGPGCTNKGFVLVAGMPLCGECVVAYQKKQQQVVLETLGDVHDGA